jgi:hypothetical protein
MAPYPERKARTSLSIIVSATLLSFGVLLLQLGKLPLPTCAKRRPVPGRLCGDDVAITERSG